MATNSTLLMFLPHVGLEPVFSAFGHLTMLVVGVPVVGLSSHVPSFRKIYAPASLESFTQDPEALSPSITFSATVVQARQR